MKISEPLNMDGSQAVANWTISYKAVKRDFRVWLESQGLCRKYTADVVNNLERYDPLIRAPMDVVRLFSDLTVGRKHQLIRAFRKLLNFYEKQGLAPKRWLDLLRSNIPSDKINMDINVPDEAVVIESLKVFAKVADVYPAHYAAYNLVLDSGLRLTEAVKAFNDIITGQLKPNIHGAFYSVDLGYFRGMKLAYLGFLTEYTISLINKIRKTAAYETISALKKRVGHNVVTYKYLRKFAFDTMTNEQLNIPESVADFIQGRTPKKIGARHYAKLKRKAVQFYPRYAEYITELRRKAGILVA